MRQGKSSLEEFLNIAIVTAVMLSEMVHVKCLVQCLMYSKLLLKEQFLFTLLSPTITFFFCLPSAPFTFPSSSSFSSSSSSPGSNPASSLLALISGAPSLSLSLRGSPPLPLQARGQLRVEDKLVKGSVVPGEGPAPVGLSRAGARTSGHRGGGGAGGGRGRGYF